MNKLITSPTHGYILAALPVSKAVPDTDYEKKKLMDIVNDMPCMICFEYCRPSFLSSSPNDRLSRTIGVVIGG